MLPHLDLVGLRVSTYPVLLTVAIATGLATAIARGRSDGLPRRDIVAPALFAIAGGLAGAKLWSVFFELRPQLAAAGESLELEHLTAGGLSILGGLGGGVFGGLVGARARAVDPVRWIDAAVPGVALALAIARVGCLCAGCCHGAPTLFPIALVYEDWSAAARPIGVPLHATPIYESLGCAALAWGLWRLPSSRGLRAGVFFAAYGTIRFTVEQLRSDYRGWSWGMPTTMLAALVLVAIGGAVLAIALRRRPRDRHRERPGTGPPDRPAASGAPDRR